MSAIEALQKMRQDLGKEESSEQDARELLLTSEEVLKVARSGVQEGATVLLRVQGKWMGTTVQVESVEADAPGEPKPAPGAAPIVRTNPAPYPG